MKKEILFEKSDAVKELESLRGAFNSERLRWLIGHDCPELMGEELYDEIVERVMVEEKVRFIIFNKARELDMEDEIKEFLIYHYGDKTIMGVDRGRLNEVMRDIREKGHSTIKGVELIPDSLWLIV